jgi:hypothetical protein
VCFYLKDGVCCCCYYDSNSIGNKNARELNCSLNKYGQIDE